MRGKVLRSLLVILFLFFSFLNNPIHSFGEGESTEYNVKAMFVLNFMKYIEWPTEPVDSFRIGIVGESEIYQSLINMTSHRMEQNKISINKILPGDTRKYQIIILSKSENKRIDDLSKKFQAKGVLLISEEYNSSNYAAINLLNINNKIRFEINNSQAKIGAIKISSKLSEFAVTVNP
jgi:hypothetical protein